MLFWWICGGESVFPVLLLRHLGAFPYSILFKSHFLYSHLKCDFHTDRMAEQKDMSSPLLIVTWKSQLTAKQSLTKKLLEESESEVTQSCPTLCDPVNCSPPGSSVHVILQARIMEWVAIYQKRYLTYKDKQKLQWDGRRNTIKIRSNPINAGWATRKLENNYTSKVHPQVWEFWAPCQAAQPQGLATKGRAPRESGFEGQEDLITGMRETNSTLGQHPQGLLRTQGKKQWSHEMRPDLPPVKEGAGCGSQWGQWNW